MTAGELLGRWHPLTRATRRFESACLQLVCGLAFAAAIAVFAPRAERLDELVVATISCALLGVLAARSWCTRRRRALEIIIAGDEELPLDDLEPVRRRLHDPRRRAQLASSLERCLRAAEGWYTTPPRLRPVANVRLLLPLERDVRDIQRLLRAAEVPRVRGVALCEWLLTDGAASPLFSGDADALRRELGRIRFALEAG